MKTLLFILLFVSSNCFAGAEIIRQGPVVVFKADCLAFNLDTLNQTLPEGVTTLPELVVLFAASLRDLTPEERALCDNVPVHIPLWVVASNKTYLDRPVYELIDPLTNERKSTNIRAAVGDDCENAVPTYSLASSGGKEWRYLAGQTHYVVVCEYK